ncbi:hypothetical protein INR49_012673 [Caranx melampygus]|nr:hypothetical protein INR49_012673 [Caranx melampygus]
MSSSSSNLHNKRLPSETERGPRLPEVDAAQQLKLRERQRFFEEVFQHDVDVYLSSAHLSIRDYKRPPIGSISSMEVNVDLLDQMELIDISDQEALDVFFSSGGEEGVLTSPLPVQGNNNNEEVISNGLFRHVLEGLDAKSRKSSTSSNSSSDSQTTNANGGNTPLVGSDDEETHASTVCVSSAAGSGLLSRHKRSWIIDSFTIEEENPGPFPYDLGKIELDREYRIYFDLFGQGVDEYPEKILSIDKGSGMLSVHGPVDYEKIKVLQLKFEARKTDTSVDTKLGLEINILDVNDNPPVFERDLYEVTVDERTTQGSNIVTVLANDIDKTGSSNSTFHYEIKSVSPNPPDTEFTINKFGAVSFKGCLDHEVAENFTILVEAIDHGEVVQLSSSTTVIVYVQDGNNHLPVISGQTGTGRVKEREEGLSPLRLHVTDKDSAYSPAWRVKYSIQGDKDANFKIETDPDTNDGILTVINALDYEGGGLKELSISVENEVPYFSCKVKDKTPGLSSDLWEVDTSTKDDKAAHTPTKVIITVEDVNDPPAFTVSVKEVKLEENTPSGTWVEKVIAEDPDSGHERDFVYKIGNDPAGWFTVDPNTGNITTIKPIDRESPHVVNGVYTISVYAVDNATDLDADPFGGPFTFELLGDVKGKWKLNPAYGYTAGLVRESASFAGTYKIDLKISDMQGDFGIYNFSVFVCDCSTTTNCRIRPLPSTGLSPGGIGVLFAALILLLVLLLLAILISCKKEFTVLQTESVGESLLMSNTEEPGTDCKVPDSILGVSTDKKYSNGQTMKQISTMNQKTVAAFSDNMDSVVFGVEQNFTTQKMGYRSERQSYQRLASLQGTEDEQLDYEPHVYAEEGDLDCLSELDSIADTDEDSLQKTVKDLGPKFMQLAYICLPPHAEN